MKVPDPAMQVLRTVRTLRPAGTLMKQQALLTTRPLIALQHLIEIQALLTPWLLIALQHLIQIQALFQILARVKVLSLVAVQTLLTEVKIPLEHLKTGKEDTRDLLTRQDAWTLFHLFSLSISFIRIVKLNFYCTRMLVGVSFFFFLRARRPSWPWVVQPSCIYTYIIDISLFYVDLWSLR